MREIRRRILDTIVGLRTRQSAEPPAAVIVGLGNPETRYARTRHNVGFWCIDQIAEDHSIDLSRRNRLALTGEGVIEGHRVILAKPRTFVNRSGQAVTYLLARYKVSPQQLLIICDDMDLPVGKVRLRPTGGSGGHRGIHSVVEGLATRDFPRLRVGIGRPPEGSDPVGYVLGNMSEEERSTVNAALARVGQAVESVVADGITAAMNRFN